MIAYYEHLLHDAGISTPPAGASIPARTTSPDYPVRLLAPSGFCGTIVLITGRVPEIPANRVVACTEDEAGPLRGLGWRPAMENSA